MVEIDNHKLQYHPERVAEWIKKGDCYPVYVEMGLTNNCNHNCIFCALDYLKEKGDFINKDVAVSSLDDMAYHGVKSIMFAGEGEPLLHKDAGYIISKAKDYGLDVSVTTNGIPFTEEKIKEILPNLSWIRFSVDAATPDTYSQIHGCQKEDYNKLLNNIEKTVNFKNKKNLETVIGAQFLLIPDNLHEVEDFTKKFKEIGVDNVQIKPYSHHPLSENDIKIKYKDYIINNNNLEKKLRDLANKSFKLNYRKSTITRLEDKTPYIDCEGLPFFALIGANGDVIPCNLFYNNKEFIYGNLNKNTFSEIWEGNQRKNVLKRLKGTENCRQGCRLDVVNRYLHRIKNPDAHDNFI